MYETELLASLEAKLQLIRDRVQGVVEGYSYGLYLYGEGGTSKSFTVEETLQSLGKPYRLTNSRLTGKGLFDLLADFPDLLHVLEDVETLFRDRFAFGVLRSALWGQEERMVTWQTAKGREEFVFTGGIILTANCALADHPELRALTTRIPCLHFQPSNEELMALMGKIASKGFEHDGHRLSPGECLEVANEIISRCRNLSRNLDLRLLVNTFRDRLQWANGASETHWVDLLDSRMKGRTLPLTPERMSRATRKANELALVARLGNLPPQERLSVWKKETGKSPAAYYRRSEELKTTSKISHILTLAN